ncbi:MAG TPA: TIGR03085 family metal-binding protein [Propionibacteriaceae bacterium]|nr:TIGR03085 family metal-binding protein [Propionibacteriaceae bacterium]
MNFAQSERNALCDLLQSAGPDAPTLCDGWDTADLAAHLWIREHDPVAMPGLAVPQLSGLTRRRMDAVIATLSWDDLVQRVRSGPARFSLFAIPGIDEETNAIEYFVHHEDVRRAGDTPASPREMGQAFEDFCWKRLNLLGRAMFRNSATGVVLERRAPGGTGDRLRMKPGSETTTVIGLASELILFSFGRTSVADVELIGEPDSIEILLGAERGV